MNAFKGILGLILALITISGCAQQANQVNSPSTTTLAPSVTQSVTPTSSSTLVPTSSLPLEKTPLPGLGTAAAIRAVATPASCQLSSISQPPQPVKTYLPNELDSETGLHITGISQWIDLKTYRLKVTGLVDHPLSLTYDDLRCMPQVTDSPDLVCPGVFTDYATWTGVQIKYILDLAGIRPEATELTLVSADGYEIKLPIETARADKNFLAYEVDEITLPVQHGFPLRAVFPSMWGSYWVKWLVEIRIT